MPSWVAEGLDDYAGRLRGDCVLRLLTVPSSRRGDAVSRRREEGQALRRVLPAAALCVALAVDGEPWSTAQLVRRFRRWREDGREVAFLIGGPDGLDTDCLAAARLRWSLSRLTLPHALVRVLVAEQLYRAWSVVQGHPYHR